MKRLINKLLFFNLFDDESIDIETIRRQRISSRVYIVALSICMCIIIIYTMFSKRTELQSFSNPSQNDYNQLLKSYSESLKCPCKNIPIEYKHFIQINTTFHAICSSDFISKKWHDYDRRDIRVRGASYFVFLSTLCQISQTRIDSALNEFLNATFLNTHMISISEFDFQINDIISQVQNNTLRKFSRSLKLLQYNSTSEINSIKPVEITNECSCGTQSDCIDSGGVYDALNDSATFRIPGWNVGCSVVERLLRSTFQCLYDQMCLNSLLFNIEKYTFGHYYHINISAMDFLNTSHFKRNTSIQNIADELFIEEWNINKSFSSFYNQCNPYECSYKIEKDDHFTYTISLFLNDTFFIEILLEKV
ncbi:hypothetical protein I4U23_012608 [Adineta vaga]|nr:hypothetical protein I4U23_012608 [Adineta vaga]